MKPILAAILLFAFMMQIFCRGLIVLDYYANTSSYKIKCENKHKPMMHCFGKCQLRKKLNQKENNDNQNPEQRGENKEGSVLSSKSFFTTGSSLLVLECKRMYPDFFPHKAIKTVRSIFHPPSHR